MAPAWVFHRGSLGDSVLLWPALRALLAAGERVTIVADGSKARLAARELGIEGVDAEQARFAALWREDESVEPERGVRRVIAVGMAESEPACAVWLANAKRMFPGAAVEGVPGRLDRGKAIELARRFDPAGGVPVPAIRSNPGGPVVFHVGAGSRDKQWGIDRWRDLAVRIEGEAIVLAGEVEAERFTRDERREFNAMGGRYLFDLLALADVLRGASLFIGGDTGPTHLAAALGVPTVALFGPTDPARWAPIGPRVEIVRAPRIAAISVDGVLAAAGRTIRAWPPSPR